MYFIQINQTFENGTLQLPRTCAVRNADGLVIQSQAVMTLVLYLYFESRCFRPWCPESFTHLQVIPNLYELVFSVEHEAILEHVGNQTVAGLHWLDFIEIGYSNSSKYLLSCSETETFWYWVNDDSVFIFGWTIPLKSSWNRRSNRSLLFCALYIWVKPIMKNKNNVKWKLLSIGCCLNGDRSECEFAGFKRTK